MISKDKAFIYFEKNLGAKQICIFFLENSHPVGAHLYNMHRCFFARISISLK